MPDYTNRTRRHPEILRDPWRFLVRVEREHHDQPVPLGECAQARRHARCVECGTGRRCGLHAGIHESRRQCFPPPGDAAFGLSHHPARTQDEGPDFFGPAHLTRAQPFDREQQDVLREIVGGRVVVQVTTAVQPHARCEAPVQFGLLGVGRALWTARDSARERFVADGLERGARVRHQPDSTQATTWASTSAGTAPRRRCSTSAAARRAAPPSPTNVDPCIAASTLGCRSASSLRRRRVLGVSGT